MAQAILIWLNDDTPVPSVIGPYDDLTDQAFNDATLLRSVCAKVLVTQINPPEKSGTLAFLNSTKEAK